MDRKQLVSFSEIASFLRVPLMVLVVCIHGVGSGIQTIDFVNHLPILSIENVYTYITELLSHSLARIAVPLFFFISQVIIPFPRRIGQKGISLQVSGKRR